MRTGNAILDVLIRVVAIAVSAALLVWVLGVLNAPSIVATLVWILALLAIAGLVVVNVVIGQARVPGPGGPTAGRAPPSDEPPPPGSRQPPRT